MNPPSALKTPFCPPCLPDGCCWDDEFEFWWKRDSAVLNISYCPTCVAEAPGYFQCARNGDETEERAVWLVWVFRRVLQSELET